MKSLFYRMLRSTRNKYNWIINENNQIVGVSKNGVLVNPLTAVLHEISSVKVGRPNKKQTVRAAREAGFNSRLAEQLYDGSSALQNRGNAQVLRGRIREALGL